MATVVNMCTFRVSESYLRYIINQQARPLLTIVNQRHVATRELCTRHCRTIRAGEFTARNILRLNHRVNRPFSALYGYACVQHLESARFLSTEQKPSLTEEILKSKLGDAVKTAEPEPSSKESKKSSDTSNSWFAGKHAWKLGLLSLVGMSVLMCGNLLIMWGELKSQSLSHYSIIGER